MEKPREKRRPAKTLDLRVRPPRRKGLRADYGDATPEDVARALLRPRPKAKGQRA